MRAIMDRSLYGTIGAALLAGAALVAESQQPAPPHPRASAGPGRSGHAVQPVSQSLGLIVYPAKKQSASQQSVDEQECYNWAKAQTGIDPQAPPPAAAPRCAAQARWTAGERRGARRGGRRSHRRSRRQRCRRRREGRRRGRRNRRRTQGTPGEAGARGASAGPAQSAQSERHATFKKAMGTCLQGRGYTTG